MDFNYVVALLEVAIEQWNLCVKSMKEEMESPHAILEGIEHRGNFEPEDLDTAVNDMRAQSQMLREIALPPTSNAFMFLGCILCKWNINIINPTPMIPSCGVHSKFSF